MDVPGLETATLDTAIGPLTIAASSTGVAAVVFGADLGASRARLEERVGPILPDRGPILAAAVDAVAAYFAGYLRAIDSLPVDVAGSEFQRRVWLAMRSIPAGRTSSYGELAAVIGAPHATRAVGAAAGDNPVPIVLPCHRVIGADGSLTGYGGGLERKCWLLRHEGVLLV
jgi:methylated-DNA-[protein]-cysteine S-methyltransferase